MSTAVPLLSSSAAAGGGRGRARAATGTRSLRGRSEAGVATLTVVLVIPVVLFMVMTVAQFVVYYHASHLATAAAQEGVRAAQAADGTEAAARDQTVDFLAQAGPSLVLSPQVDVSRGADSARVEVRGQAPRVVPVITVGIRAVATGPVERFDPDTVAP